MSFAADFEKTNLTGIIVSAYCEEGSLRKAIFSYKYDSIKALLVQLADLLIKHLQKFPINSEAILMPVPLHKNRLRKRGFNQASLLVKEASRTFGYQYSDNIYIEFVKQNPR